MGMSASIVTINKKDLFKRVAELNLAIEPVEFILDQCASKNSETAAYVLDSDFADEYSPYYVLETLINVYTGGAIEDIFDYSSFGGVESVSAWQLLEEVNKKFNLSLELPDD